jgi:DNA uptake lipoprotein
MLEMPESRLLYFQWNFIQNWGDEDFPHFVARMFQKLDQHPDWRLAIDVRYNSGGNGELVANLIRQIIKRDRFDTPGNLFVIIGRKTFSAAVDFVGEAKHWTSAIFVGEPTGAGLNAYGDPDTFETPNLHIPFQISTAYHQHEVSSDRAGEFKPDIPAVMHAAQYFAGSDPSLDAIREGTDLLPIPVLATQAGAQEASRALERRRRLWSALPWYVPFTEHDMNKAGYAALAAGKIDDAVAAFEMNAAQYPSSWNVWDSLGEAQRAAKQIKNAKASYEKSLVLYPGNKNARDAINEMEKNSH